MTKQSFSEDMPDENTGAEGHIEQDERRVRHRREDEDPSPRRGSRSRSRQEADDEDETEYDDEESKGNKKLIIGAAGAAGILLILWYTGTASQIYNAVTGQNSTPPPVVHHSTRPKLAGQNRPSRHEVAQSDDTGGSQAGDDSQSVFPPASDDDAPPSHSVHRRGVRPRSADQDPLPPTPERDLGDNERTRRLGQSREAMPTGSQSPAITGGLTTPATPITEESVSKDLADKLNNVLAKLDDMSKKMSDIEKISERQEAKVEQGAIAVVNMSAKLDGLVGRMNDQQANIESLKDAFHGPSPKKATPPGDTPPDVTKSQKTDKKDEKISTRPRVLRGYILKGVSEGDPPTSVFIKTPDGAIMKNINEDVGGNAGVIKEIRQIKGGSWEVVTTKGIIPAG